MQPVSQSAFSLLLIPLQIFDYDFKNDAIVCTTGDRFLDELPTRFANTTHTAINNILLNENNENVVILQNDSFLFVLKNDTVIKATDDYSRIFYQRLTLPFSF